MQHLPHINEDTLTGLRTAAEFPSLNLYLTRYPIAAPSPTTSVFFVELTLTGFLVSISRPKKSVGGCRVHNNETYKVNSCFPDDNSGNKERKKKWGREWACSLYLLYQVLDSPVWRVCCCCLDREALLPWQFLLFHPLF